MNSQKVIGPSRPIRSINSISRAVMRAVPERRKAQALKLAPFRGGDSSLLHQRSLRGSGLWLFHFFGSDVAATKDEPSRVLLHDLVLESHQSVEQRLRPWRAAWYINIHRHNSIDSLQGGVCRE